MTKKYYLFLIALSVIFITAILVTLTINQAVVDLKINYQNDLITRNKNIAKQKEQKQFKELIEKQEKNKTVTNNIDTDEKILQAIGEYNLKIVFVLPTKKTYTQALGLINNLKSTDLSLNYINIFLSKEMKKYSDKNFKLNMNYYGPYYFNNIPTVGDMMNLWGKDAFGLLKLEDAFDKLLTAYQVPASHDDLTIFLYFDNSYDKQNDEKAYSYYDYKKFRSFAEKNKKTAYINIYRLDPDFTDGVTEIVTHELLHLFGATDKYEENYDSGRMCSARGRAFPKLAIFVPQEQADIMCMYIEYEENKFKRARLINDTLMINEITAREIGWIK